MVKMKLGMVALALVGSFCLFTAPAKADFGISIGGRQGGINVYSGGGYYQPYRQNSYNSFRSYGVPAIRSYNYGYYGRPSYQNSYSPQYRHGDHHRGHHDHYSGHHDHYSGHHDSHRGHYDSHRGNYGHHGGHR